MSDLRTQLQAYLDANVERVTAEDVFAGGRVVEQVHAKEPKWQPTPRLAAALGFVMTTLVIGGSLGLALLIRQPGIEAGDGGYLADPGTPTSAAVGWLMLGIAAALAVIAMGLMVHAIRGAGGGLRMKRKEHAMATTFDTPPSSAKLGDAHRANRWLIATILVLAVALVALGAWVVYDLTATSGTEGPAELHALVDDYNEAWNSYDGEALMGLVSKNFVHSATGMMDRDAESTAAIIELSESNGFQVETIGDRVVAGEGPVYYVAMLNRLSTTADPDGAEGISVIRAIEYPDSGWVVTNHYYLGGYP